MPLLNIEESSRSRSDTRIALFDLGFRPFFLLAGISAILLVTLWAYSFAYGGFEFAYFSPITWHSHEMIFGYAVAVIAGFLLTAVRNWTGIQTPSGKALAGLVILWAAGRIAPFASDIVPPWSIALIDTAFLPVLGLSLAIPILRKRQRHNLVFLVVLTALTASNILVHLQALGFTSSTARTGIYLAVYMIILLIVILGGRVIPSFTVNGITGGKTRRWKTIEYLSIASVIAVIVLDLTTAAPAIIGSAALFAAVVHGMRLLGWYQNKVWTVPLVWVLHLGYAWIVAGFVLKAAASAGWINPLLAIHAFTTAGIGTMTLGMMARVSLGHTGRVLQVKAAMSWAFILINLAGVTRVFLPIIVPANYTAWIVLASVFWGMAFGIFVISYAAILVKPRIDGRPG